MFPARKERISTGDMAYPNVFVGPVDHPAPVEVDPANLNTDYVDARGYLKPGMPLRIDGTRITAAGQAVFGCNIEALKVAASNSVDDLAAADPVKVPVATIAQVNADLLEDVLGRALSADERAAFGAAGSRIVLIG
jgi:hypothetical protein